ncbi:recombination-associated protein RdgC [Escherichia coli]|uniref:recombination-associated protein RdgC n=1 Tax=Escherichia coli TaxID=562 RepID=UPI00203C7A27|nr:recombination-associated protein RdgC [Escherichia coli]
MEKARKMKQSRKLKTKNTLKDEALHSLLPRAFTRKSLSRILIDRDNYLVFVEASSARKAEEMLALLRNHLAAFR